MTCRSTKTEATGAGELTWSCSRTAKHTGRHEARSLTGSVLRRWARKAAR